MSVDEDKGRKWFRGNGSMETAPPPLAALSITTTFGSRGPGGAPEHKTCREYVGMQMQMLNSLDLPRPPVTTALRVSINLDCTEPRVTSSELWRPAQAAALHLPAVYRVQSLADSCEGIAGHVKRVSSRQRREASQLPSEASQPPAPCASTLTEP